MSEMKKPLPDHPLFFLSAGEPSGDIHAARLIEELKKRFPNAGFAGFGGPEMEKAGCRLLFCLTGLAVMWIGQVIGNIFRFMKLIRQTDRFFREQRPDMVILVDYPGFNWKIAAKAKKYGIPVCYFMPPQIWGWAQWRVKKMKRLVDHVLCCLPFEKKWFQEHHCDVCLIGHPFLAEIRNRKPETDFLTELQNRVKAQRKNTVLTILPGSRNQEVTMNISDMLQAVQQITRQVPDVYPVIAAFKEVHAEWIRRQLTENSLDIPVYVGRTPELIHAATCCFSVSGSVSMELLASLKPTVIYYRLGKIAWFVMPVFKRVRYITLVNLIAVDRLENESAFFPESQWIVPRVPSFHDQKLMAFPEFMSCKNQSSEAASILVDWLRNSQKRNQRIELLTEILQETDFTPNPIQNAAEYIEQTFLQ